MAEITRGTTKAAVSAAGVVFTGSARLVKLVVTTAGSAGTLTIKDGTGDVVYSSVGTLALGSIVELDMPIDVSINVASLGTGQVLEVLYSQHKGA